MEKDIQDIKEEIKITEDRIKNNSTPQVNLGKYKYVRKGAIIAQMIETNDWLPVGKKVIKTFSQTKINSKFCFWKRIRFFKDKNDEIYLKNLKEDLRFYENEDKDKCIDCLNYTRLSDDEMNLPQLFYENVVVFTDDDDVKTCTNFDISNMKVFNEIAEFTNQIEGNDFMAKIRKDLMVECIDDLARFLIVEKNIGPNVGYFEQQEIKDRFRKLYEKITTFCHGGCLSTDSCFYYWVENENGVREIEVYLTYMFYHDSFWLNYITETDYKEYEPCFLKLRYTKDISQLENIKHKIYQCLERYAINTNHTLGRIDSQFQAHRVGYD